MRRYRFLQVDVFSRRAFGGNQLAVFPDAAGLSDGEMQAIAAEMNYSESTFVLPPEDPAADARVRIFTPVAELPFAGHPTVGTGFLLGRERGKRELGLQLGVGTLRVEVDPGDGLVGSARMEQPLPAFWPVEVDRAGLAAMVGLAGDDLAEDAPIEVGSAGVPFVYLPVGSLAAVGRARGRAEALERAWPMLWSGPERPAAYLFSTETVAPESAAHARMFSLLGQGAREDPATGGASGPFGAYLVRHGLRPAGRLLLEQGYEMGRPSQVEVDVEVADGAISRVQVGGGVVLVAEGQLLIGQPGPRR